MLRELKPGFYEKVSEIIPMACRVIIGGNG